MLIDINSIRCDEDNDGYITCSFEDWIKDETGTTWAGIYCSMVEDDKDEEEILQRREELLEQFYDFCEAWEVEGIDY